MMESRERLRILASALSCNGSMGSEPLVGFKTVEALCEDHRVTVISSPPTQPPVKANLVTCDAGPCVFNEIDSPALLRFESRQWLAMRRLVKKQNFDLIHHVTPSHIDAISLLGGFGVPMVIGPALSSDPAPESFRAFFSRPMGSPQPRLHPSRILRAVCYKAFQVLRDRKGWFEVTRAVIAGVPGVRHHLPEKWQGIVRDIPYAGVEHDRFVPPDAKSHSDKLRLLFVGRMVPYKGVDLILHALAKLGPDIRYEARFIGQSHPAYQAHCDQVSRDLGLGDHVRFEPAVPRDQLTSAYQQADVFLMPSIETYGIALLEAMSCGLPSIVADLNGPGCILPDEAGVKIPLHDPERFIADLAAAIALLGKDADLRAKMGATARDHVLRVHDWDRIGGMIRSFIDEVFVSQSAPSRQASNVA